LFHNLGAWSGLAPLPPRQKIRSKSARFGLWEHALGCCYGTRLGSIVVPFGTAKNAVPLAGTLKATVEGGEKNDCAVAVNRWICSGCDMEMPGTYRFTPELDLMLSAHFTSTAVAALFFRMKSTYFYGEYGMVNAAFCGEYPARLQIFDRIWNKRILRFVQNDNEGASTASFFISVYIRPLPAPLG